MDEDTLVAAMTRRTISIEKAVELVSVSRRTIYNWIKSGRVEYVRTASGSIRIFVDTLWRGPEFTRPINVTKPGDASD